jgi:hypothetical protein
LVVLLLATLLHVVLLWVLVLTVVGGRQLPFVVILLVL